jgi:hypothetical protein
MTMIRLCESCYQVIVDGEPYAVLRSLYKVRNDGCPEWAELYLHHYDSEIRGCAVRTGPGRR